MPRPTPRPAPTRLAPVRRLRIVLPPSDPALPPRRWSVTLSPRGVDVSGRLLSWARLLPYLLCAERAPSPPRRRAPLLSVSWRPPISGWRPLSADIHIDRPRGLVLVYGPDHAVLCRWSALVSLALLSMTVHHAL